MTDFEPPDWLGRTLFSDFRKYGDNGAGHVWYTLRRDDYTILDSLYATHTRALEGDPECLEIMRLYYLALTTKRLKS
mgnify:CR=1 FL=1